MGSGSEDEVRELLAQLVAAWNAGDAVSFGALFDEHADYVTVLGSHSAGRAAITELHSFLFRGPFRGSRLEGYGADASVRFPADGMAVIVSHGSLRQSGATEASVTPASISTTVLVRRPSGWAITSFQNTPVRAYGPEA